MKQQLNTQKLVPISIVFTLVLPFCGALGFNYHAAVETGAVILSAYAFYKMGLTIKQIAWVQLPIILFTIGLVLFNQLYANLALMCGLVIGFWVMPLYIFFLKKPRLVTSVLLTLLVMIAVYSFHEWFMFHHNSANDVGVNNTILPIEDRLNS